MKETKPPSEFYAEYDLAVLRQHEQRMEPALHQRRALERLGPWYEDRAGSGCGGILVLPTGGGKTFTATHFACRLPLSQGFKVLWLAHTHHLLEQAFASFATAAGLLAEPKSELRVRV